MTSQELQFLLKRIQSPEPKMIIEPVQASVETLRLLKRMDNRKWKQQMESELLARLEEFYYELKFIDHAMKCGQCLLELSLDVTRYGGAHSGIWYLDLQYETGWYPEVYDEDPLYKTAPRIDKYNWGSYWKRTTNIKEAIRFIKDRMKWAKPIIYKEVEAAVDFLVAVQDWDLESQLPAYDPLFPLFFLGCNYEVNRRRETGTIHSKGRCKKSR